MLIECDHCGEEFNKKPSQIRKYNSHYCSAACRVEGQKGVTMAELTCTMCGKDFKRKESQTRDKEKFFCCRECHMEYNSNSIETECDTCGKTVKKIMSKISPSGKVYCSRECSYKGKRGSNHYAWKGGVSYGYDRGPKHTAWRKAVFHRDNHTCQKCNTRGSQKVNAHHLLSYSRYPEHRHDVSNGVTLCVKCHKEFHTLYGIRTFTANDCIDWLGEIDSKGDINEI